MEKREKFICFAIGSVVYPVLEIFWRGYTHFSMALLGGVCFALIYSINEKFFHFRAVFRAFICACVISVLEFFCGVVLNIFLRLDVWDYSREVCNIYGQICLSYCILWYFLSLLCCPVCVLLKKLFKKQIKKTI